jgi:hypothetical protein
MRRMVLIIFLLTGTLTLSLSVVRGISYRHTPPEFVANLHLSECALPCWNGIMPGETLFPDAIQRIHETYANNDQAEIEDGIVSPKITLKRGNKPYVVIELYGSKTTVYQITFDFINAQVEFRDLYFIFGPPMRVISERDQLYIMLYGDRDQYGAYLVGTLASKTCDDHARYMVLHRPIQMPEIGLPMRAVVAPWRNFAEVKKLARCN